MIPSNQIRIGNFVKDKDGSFYQIASGSDIEGSWSEIELSPEILEKAGFKDKGCECGQYGLQLKSGCISFQQNLFHVYSGLGDWESYAFDVEIKYLHHLQNLIQSLTGEELEIKL